MSYRGDPPLLTSAFRSTPCYIQAIHPYSPRHLGQPPVIQRQSTPTHLDIYQHQVIQRQSTRTHLAIYEHPVSYIRGDVVAQLVERLPRDPMDSMTRGSNPVRSIRNICESCSESKCCADSLSVCYTPVCIRTHNNVGLRALKIL